jgi:hypothetical protein
VGGAAAAGHLDEGGGVALSGGALPARIGLVGGLVFLPQLVVERIELREELGTILDVEVAIDPNAERPRLRAWCSVTSPLTSAAAMIGILASRLASRSRAPATLRLIPV